MKVIITGATGMVGEGVLLECLQNAKVSEVLIINRKHYALNHPKLIELLVSDFMKIENYEEQLKGYDACFYCAGVSSSSMSEETYTKITFETTLHFAKVLLENNPSLVFNFVSGRSTDSTEQGKIMWARVKGKTENSLKQMPFKKEYNFRPAGMLPFPEQKNAKKSYTFIVNLIRLFAPSSVLTLSEVGKAMINVVKENYPQNILEVKDIKTLSR